MYALSAALVAAAIALGREVRRRRALVACCGGWRRPPPGGRRSLHRAIVAALLVACAGCDAAAVRLAREGADRQARQNEVMAQLQGQVAQGTRELAAAEGAARRQAIELHRDLQQERSALAAGWSELEAQRRRELARSRRTSLLTALVPASGAALAALGALAFAWLALGGGQPVDDDASAAEALLIDELLARDARPEDAVLPPPAPRQLAAPTDEAR
ncbi:MAG TPA: hypothetical protein PJ982_19530 [Lacipirellulaceae bacterium]|nr:hypothetical protein [Lacipirellulaceae bacterium]